MANAPLLLIDLFVSAVKCTNSTVFSHANPRAMSPHMPTLTLVLILRFHKKTVGSRDRQMSVEAATTVRPDQQMLLRTDDWRRPYVLGLFRWH